ncbi:MAG: RimK/LysX family protein [Hyphomicrobiales bacterium]|nr:RimK/LysX family protein [Hyphomicrobiales bacterium]
MRIFFNRVASRPPATGALAALLILAVPPPVAGAMSAFRDSGQPVVAGWIEHVWLTDNKERLQAKLDTGAKSSSIHAEQMETFSRNGQDWVRFSLRNEVGAELRVQRPVARTATIKRAGSESQERLVVRLVICLGGFTGETDFTLADRAGMNYPILIGRKFMDDRFLVSSSLTFQLDGRCSVKNK